MKRSLLGISDIVVVLLTLLFAYISLRAVAGLFYERPMSVALLGAALGLLFPLFGVGRVVQAFLERRRAEASGGWSSIRGTISASSVKEYVSHNQEGEKRSYVPAVSYDYSVAGGGF